MQSGWKTPPPLLLPSLGDSPAPAGSDEDAPSQASSSQGGTQ